jgi:Tfp pilus assembly protein PilN
MTVRVNLLPREFEVLARQRRTAFITAAVLLAFIAALAALYVLQLGAVASARADRDDARAEVTRLETRVAELQQYQQMADQLAARNALLTTAMEREISWSRVLNDLSLAFPGNASLQTLAATALAPGDVGLGEDTPVANLQFSGYSVEEYAPGVEAVLIEFDKVRSFFNVFLATAAQEEIDGTEVTNFNSTVQLDEEAYTHRYVDGLPEGVGR